MFNGNVTNPPLLFSFHYSTVQKNLQVLKSTRHDGEGGSQTDTGGGGGTFVSINGRSSPLIVAGGGGGTRGNTDDGDGQDASLEPAGKDGVATQGSAAVGGKDGKAGDTAGGGWGGGGAGYFEGEGCAKAFVDFADGDGPCDGGGIGGGGAAAGDGGGGGGGYSGGGGASSAGGGGSFVREDGTDTEKKIGEQEFGEIVIIKSTTV